MEMENRFEPNNGSSTMGRKIHAHEVVVPGLRYICFSGSHYPYPSISYFSGALYAYPSTSRFIYFHLTGRERWPKPSLFY
jgi:hypothetical protein